MQMDIFTVNKSFQALEAILGYLKDKFVIRNNNVKSYFFLKKDKEIAL